MSNKIAGTAQPILTSPHLGTPDLSFRNVWKTFAADRKEKFVAVREINLEVQQGTFVCIVGPSGCGKSTLLNMAAGLMAPSQGSVRYRGEIIRGVNRDVGYITQHNNLLPWRTLEKDVGVALELRHIGKAERRRSVEAMLKTVGLDGFGRRYPSQLSGGMQKRAALARTLIYNPNTLLMDEPFGPLDAQLRVKLQQELLNLWERDKKTVLFVTHDLDEAILLGDRVVVFSPCPGRVIHIEDVTFERPRDIVALRSTPEFGAVWERLWKLLKVVDRADPTRVNDDE